MDILRILDDVAAHFVGLSLNAALVVVNLRNRQLHTSLMLLITQWNLLLLMLRRLLLLLLLLVRRTLYRPASKGSTRLSSN
jgi:hypothetical protein